ncbi:MAG: DJ-1/PfpI family protein [Firmicutes bacterium]|nr:DJ-1/PfpI family protein [Bacillota bacterium]
MINVYLADGFEEVEALTAVDVLRRAGIPVQTVSITDDKMVRGTHDIYVQADTVFADVDHNDCEMIVLPGGLPGAANLQDFKPLEEQIIAFAQGGKKLAAICAAPMVFGELGLLEGKNATIYPGMEEHLKGANATDLAAVVDGNITTGKGPAFAMTFALTLVEVLQGEAKASEVASGLLLK